MAQTLLERIEEVGVDRVLDEFMASPDYQKLQAELAADKGELKKKLSQLDPKNQAHWELLSVLFPDEG